MTEETICYDLGHSVQHPGTSTLCGWDDAGKEHPRPTMTADKSAVTCLTCKSVLEEMGEDIQEIEDLVSCISLEERALLYAAIKETSCPQCGRVNAHLGSECWCPDCNIIYS